MWGIVQNQHDGPATTVYPSIELAHAAMRNSIPGARLVECDHKGNRVEPVATDPSEKEDE